MDDLNVTDEGILNNPLVVGIVAKLEQQLPIKWPYEWLILQSGFHKNIITIEDVKESLEKQFHIQITTDTHDDLIQRAMERLTKSDQKQNWRFGTLQGDTFKLDTEVSEILNDPLFGPYIKERVHYGLIEFRRMNNIEALASKEIKLTMYQTYTRNELIYLFSQLIRKGLGERVYVELKITI